MIDSIVRLHSEVLEMGFIAEIVCLASDDTVDDKIFCSTGYKHIESLFRLDW